MNLPLEIQRMIYKSAILTHNVIPYNYQEGQTRIDRSSHTIMALLWTSHQLHAEMAAVLNEFPRIWALVSDKEDLNALLRWVRSKGPLGGVGAHAFGMDTEETLELFPLNGRGLGDMDEARAPAITIQYKF